MKELDKNDGWAEFAENNISSDIINVFGEEMGPKFANNKAFMNVYKKVAIDDIGEAVISEAKRLGTDKEVKALFKPGNIKKMVNEWKQHKADKKAQKILNTKK